MGQQYIWLLQLDFLMRTSDSLAFALPESREDVVHKLTRNGTLPRVAKAVARFICLSIAILGMIISSTAEAQSSGVLGWSSSTGPGGYYDTADQACRAQWGLHNPERLSRYIGAFPSSASPFRANCSWTLYQYLCHQETGGGINDCGTVFPSFVEFSCAAGYQPSIGGHCIKSPDFVPERKQCSFNNGAQNNTTTPNPITLSTGSKGAQAKDFETADGLFSIGRSYRSLPVGRTAGARSMPQGLVGGWAFDFTYELQLGSFSGSPASPNAHLSLVAPDGTGYDFLLQADGTWIPDTATGQVWAPTDLKLEYVGTLPSNLADITTTTSTWRLTDGNDTVWVFHTFAQPNSSAYVTGRPITRTKSGGYTWSFAYNADTSLQSVTDSFGRAATFTWYKFFITTLSTPPAGASPFPVGVATITLPDGTSLRYSYDPAPATVAPSTAMPQRLIKVERLSAASAVIDSTSYLYENAALRTHLTGIVDNRNVRIASYGYDANGRGTSTQGADGANKYLVSYGESTGALTRTVTNPLGKVAVYTFSRFGTGAPDIRLTQVEGEPSPNCPGSVRSLTYGSDTFIATEVDEEGRVTSYTRDSHGRPTTKVEAVGTPDARTTTTVWNATFNQPDSVASPGVTETRLYNAAGLVSSLTSTDTTSIVTPYPTNGRTRTWTYDWSSTGLLEAVDGPLPGSGDTITYTYSPSGYLATATDQVGHTTTVTSRNGRGDPLAVEDENGVQTAMTYDGMGRPLTITINPGAAQSQYQLEYDAIGDLTRLTLPEGAWLQYTYDDAKRVTGVLNNRGETQAFEYNAMGGITTSAIRDASSAIVRQQSSVFDELGRLIKTIGGAKQTSSYAYDKVNNLTRKTDGQAGQWQNGWDALNRLASTTDPEAAVTTYRYAPNDNLSDLTDPRGMKTLRTVDGFGLTIKEHNPDRGDRTYWYDEADRLVKMVDAKGQESLFSYDNANRRLSETFTGASSQNIAYSYDATSGGNKGIGRLTGVTDASGTSSFIYDAQGRLVAETKGVGGQSYPLQYSYDANGFVTAITYPSGHILTYTRASDGKITGVSEKPSALGSSTVLASGVTFQPFGSLTGLTYGNGLILSRSYDRNYWLSGITLTDGSTPLLSLSLSRDQNGNLASITDNAGTGRDAVFGYSGAERLSLSVGPWSTTGDQGAEMGTISNTSNRALIYRAESGPVASDPNLAIGTTFTYNYNARQRLANLVKDGSSIASYEYDHAGLRVSATRSGSSPATVHYIFDPSGHLLAEHDGSTGALIREYVWLDDMPLALVAGTVSAPDYYFVHTGQIDEPLIVTNASKTKVWDAVLDPWGRATLLSTPSQQLNLRLPGQWYAAESSLHQNWMREYDPALGRYIEADPLGVDAGPNPYAYVEGNPINRTDPMGLQSFPPFVPPPPPVYYPPPPPVYYPSPPPPYYPPSLPMAPPRNGPKPPSPKPQNPANTCRVDGGGGDPCTEGWYNEFYFYCDRFRGYANRRCKDRANDRLHACKHNGGQWPPASPPRWTHRNEVDY